MLWKFIGSTLVLLISTIFTISIRTDMLEQTVQTQMRCHRMWHLIRVYTVCYWSSNFSTQHRVVNCTCSNFRTNMVRSCGIQILRVNTVLRKYFLWGNKTSVWVSLLFRAMIISKTLFTDILFQHNWICTTESTLSSTELPHETICLRPYTYLWWGFTAQSTQWGHVERGQFT